MYFEFSEEQKMLRASARDFLATQCPKTLVRAMVRDEKGYTQELWRSMANMGWMGLIVPEKYGGSGGSLMDLLVLLEEMGRACLPGPFFSTVVLGGFALLEMGNNQQKYEFLHKIVTGEVILTLALSEPSSARYDPGSVDLTATGEEDKYVINGIKLFVPDAHVADYIICVTRTRGISTSTDGITLFLVDSKNSGVSCRPLKTIAGDKQFEVIFNRVRVPTSNILGELHSGFPALEKLLQKAAVAKCAEMVGGAQRVLEMAVEYAKQRVQFGKPIGAFQAVQHHCANMLIDVDGAKFITYKEAWLLDNNKPCAREVSVAKAWVNEAYRRVCLLGHQILAGVGYMIDHDMPLYTVRAKGAELAFGGTEFHREIVAKELGL